MRSENLLTHKERHQGTLSCSLSCVLSVEADGLLHHGPLEHGLEARGEAETETEDDQGPRGGGHHGSVVIGHQGTSGDVTVTRPLTQISYHEAFIQEDIDVNTETWTFRCNVRQHNSISWTFLMYVCCLLLKVYFGANIMY